MTRHILIWGWLRLFLGIMQISSATAGVWMLLRVGFSPVTLVVIGGALTPTIISRLLYQGRSNPMMADIKRRRT